MQSLSFYWLTGNGILAHTPLTKNIVADILNDKRLGSSNITILLSVFNKTNIPLVLVGYDIYCYSQLVAMRLVGYLPYIYYTFVSLFRQCFMQYNFIGNVVLV